VRRKRRTPTDNINFLSLLGEIPAKSKLNLKVFEELDCESFIRRKIGYSAEAGEAISAFLCISKNIKISRLFLELEHAID